MTVRLVIAGNFAPTHVGRHLHDAAVQLGISYRTFDIGGHSGNALLRAIRWHLLGRRPTGLQQYSRDIAALCADEKPDVLLSTGAAPITSRELQAIRRSGVVRVNYSTDDPWNPAHKSSWFLDALPHYDFVFTPRRANIEQFRALGIPCVEYLPFAYAPSIHYPSQSTNGGSPADVTLTGNADRDRAALIAPLLASGLHIGLYGYYWDRFSETRRAYCGYADEELMRSLARSSKVSLCIVRRANRDGHCMRTFELPSMRACMLVERTMDHEAFFGVDGERVRFFSGPHELVAVARELVDDDVQRERLATAVRAWITSNGHTYCDRLSTILRTVGTN